MTTYDIYLETAENGNCVAHVLDLPGCFVAVAGRKQAISGLPEVIRSHCHDLIRHGEQVSMPDSIKLAVAEEHANSGAFHPDDRAALFEPERRPMKKSEIERFLTLAAYNREDLLALVRGLSDSILDWRSSAGAMTIREILYHVGRADLWYISRVTEPAAAPDWRAMPARRFLSLSRASVASQFRALSDGELAAVSYPPRPEGDDPEPWTVRKALRRLLEHEREHTRHIGEIMLAWREQLMARLAASRSAFIWQLVSLDEAAISRQSLFDTEVNAPWTAKDLLGHVAAWDELYAGRTNLVRQGRVAAIEPVDLEGRNAALAESRKGWTLDQAMLALSAAREQSLVAIGSVADADLHRRFRLPWGRRATLATWARWRFMHDDQHAKDILDWRSRAKPQPAVGPKAMMQAAMESGRQEMLATVALVPVEARETRPLCGVWTLKDVLGHVADWEWYGVEKLDGPPSRRSLDIRFRRIQEWNEAHAAARKDQPWEEVWSDFQAARLALGQLLERMSQEDLAKPFAVPWSRKWTVYRWIHLWLHHEREHAADLRLNLDLPWPRRLKTFK